MQAGASVAGLQRGRKDVEFTLSASTDSNYDNEGLLIGDEANVLFVARQNSRCPTRLQLLPCSPDK